MSAGMRRAATATTASLGTGRAGPPDSPSRAEENGGSGTNTMS